MNTIDELRDPFRFSLHFAVLPFRYAFRQWLPFSVSVVPSFGIVPLTVPPCTLRYVRPVALRLVSGRCTKKIDLNCRLVLQLDFLHLKKLTLLNLIREIY